MVSDAVSAAIRRSKPLAWVQIGSMAGADITLPSYLLRAANLRIMGSGQGSLTTAGILAELPALAEGTAAGALAIDPLAFPLSQVERAWNAPPLPANASSSPPAPDPRRPTPGRLAPVGRRRAPP